MLVGELTVLNWTWSLGDERSIGYLLCDGVGEREGRCHVQSKPKSIKNLTDGSGFVNVSAPSTGTYWVEGFTFTLTPGSDPQDDNFDDMFRLFRSPNITAVRAGDQVDDASTSAISSSNAISTGIPTATITITSSSLSTTRIVGGVLGAICGICLIVIITLVAIIIRRRTRRQDSVEGFMHESSPHIGSVEHGSGNTDAIPYIYEPFRPPVTTMVTVLPPTKSSTEMNHQHATPITFVHEVEAPPPSYISGSHV
ncbi:hypothetical protein VNI00_006733 [Paramarasmius palmivorus]|uniref:Uncharacterized protein n=1 Tax=Paramarasmius palmivorus TaxID=297713 RepID=A0AAW0D4J9_9AGAR